MAEEEEEDKPQARRALQVGEGGCVKGLRLQAPVRFEALRSVAGSSSSSYRKEEAPCRPGPSQQH